MTSLLLALFSLYSQSPLLSVCLPAVSAQAGGALHPLHPLATTVGHIYFFQQNIHHIGTIDILPNYIKIHPVPFEIFSVEQTNKTMLWCPYHSWQKGQDCLYSVVLSSCFCAPIIMCPRCMHYIRNTYYYCSVLFRHLLFWDLCHVTSPAPFVAWTRNSEGWWGLVGNGNGTSVR